MAGVTWSGLNEFMRDLHGATAAIQGQADTILVDAADAAQQQIFQTYPRGSGKLRLGLSVKRAKVGAQVLQKARHAWIYERGTKQRQTKDGFNRGVMPAKPTFVPIAEQHHDKAKAAIKSILYDMGASRVTEEE